MVVYFMENGLYGLKDKPNPDSPIYVPLGKIYVEEGVRDGEKILVPAKYELPKSYETSRYHRLNMPSDLYVNMEVAGHKIPIMWNNHYFGVISTSFDECRRIFVRYDSFYDYYLVKKNGLYGIQSGLTTLKCKEQNPRLDIILDCRYLSITVCKDATSFKYSHRSPIIIIVEDEFGYFLFDINKQEEIGNERYDAVSFVYAFAPYNVPIPLNGPLFIVEKNGFKGLLNQYGKSLMPLEYDEITFKYECDLLIYSNKQGNIAELSLEDLIGEPLLRKRKNSIGYERTSYEKYGGPDGYSDNDIDTIFDGDPSAIWNID